MANGNEPKGLGGLLIVFLLGLVLLAAAYLKFGYDLVHGFQSNMGFIPFNIGVVGIFAAVGVLLKRKSAILLTRVFLILNALFCLVSTVLLPFLFPLLGIAIFYGAFNWAYLDSSRRVKNTLVN